MKIAQDTVVSMHYTVSSADGAEIDSTEGSTPLDFIFGHGYLIAGLEKALSGLEANAKLDTTVPAEEAYGPRHEELVQAVPINMFEGMEPQVGMQFRATTEQGEQSVIIIDVTDEHVVVDGNHPLAGHDLTFNVEVVSVRAATAEELEQGLEPAEPASCCDTGENCKH